MDLCGVPPVSEMTYTVSNGTLNPSIPYHCGVPQKVITNKLPFQVEEIF